MRCCKWFHCVFTHISGDSSACSSVDIRGVEEERGGQEECYWYLMSAPTSIHFETQFQIPHTYIVWNPYFDINCSKTSNYRSIKLATMVHFIVYSWNFISGVWTLDRDGRIYRSIINCSKLRCSGVWRAGAEASPLQPRPQVRPRAGGHEAGAPQQAHRWAVIGGERVTWPHCSYLIGPPPQRCPPGTGSGSWSRPRPATTAPSLTPTSRSSARTPPPPRWRTHGTGSG